MEVSMYPQVFAADTENTLYFRFDAAIDPAKLEIKVIPMEIHTVPHTDFHINEGYRYPWSEIKSEGDNVFSLRYFCKGEQRHYAMVKYNGQRIARCYAYSVAPDLAELNCYKGDTHLHTNCSDGEGTPFEVACAYRSIGCDFIAITDHHKYWPSVQTKEEMEPLTKAFTVFKGEEVHNMDMGYFHLINFAGDTSVNEIIENDDAYVQAEIEKLLQERDFTGLQNPRSAAFRVFVANESRKGGGVAVLPHPYWNIGEYQVPPEETIYHLRHGDYDVLEVIAANDHDDNGNDLQEMLRAELLAEGCKIPVCGASDAHYALSRKANGLFGIQFSLVFAKSPQDIPEAMKNEQGVAVKQTDETHFHVVGRYRYGKYARFLLKEYFPTYTALTETHAKALAEKDPVAIGKAEADITAYKKQFFAI